MFDQRKIKSTGLKLNTRRNAAGHFYDFETERKKSDLALSYFYVPNFEETSNEILIRSKFIRMTLLSFSPTPPQ